MSAYVPPTCIYHLTEEDAGDCDEEAEEETEDLTVPNQDRTFGIVSS